MPRTKDEVLSIRTTAEVKNLLRRAADRERRSVASMVEVLVYEYATRTSIRTAVNAAKSMQKLKRRTLPERHTSK